MHMNRHKIFKFSRKALFSFCLCMTTCVFSQAHVVNADPYIPGLALSRPSSLDFSRDAMPQLIEQLQRSRENLQSKRTALQSAGLSEQAIDLIAANLNDDITALQNVYSAALAVNSKREIGPVRYQMMSLLPLIDQHYTLINTTVASLETDEVKNSGLITGLQDIYGTFIATMVRDPDIQADPLNGLMKVTFRKKGFLR